MLKRISKSIGVTRFKLLCYIQKNKNRNKSNIQIVFTKKNKSYNKKNLYNKKCPGESH